MKVNDFIDFSQNPILFYKIVHSHDQLINVPVTAGSWK